MKLFTISGLDGSGKSTQIALLKTYLESQGRKVFYFHAVKFGLANKNRNQDQPKSVTKANFFQIFLRRIFLMIDLLRFKSLRKKLIAENYDYLLSDRYFFDTIVNIYYLRGSDAKIKCEDKIIRPDVAIYLAVDPASIMARERKPDQGLEYLEKKKIIYDGKFATWQMRKIDGNGQKDLIFEEIKNLAT